MGPARRRRRIQRLLSVTACPAPGRSGAVHRAEKLRLSGPMHQADGMDDHTPSHMDRRPLAAGGYAAPQRKSGTPMIHYLVCANCDREFAQAGRLEAFCGEDCRTAAWAVRTLREALAQHRGPRLGTILPDPDKAKLFAGLSATERMVRLEELHRRIHAKIPERACDGPDWDRQAWIKLGLAPGSGRSPSQP
jgi:hypothetical protein